MASSFGLKCGAQKLDRDELQCSGAPQRLSPARQMIHERAFGAKVRPPHTLHTAHCRESALHTVCSAHNAQRTMHALHTVCNARPACVQSFHWRAAFWCSHLPPPEAQFASSFGRRASGVQNGSIKRLRAARNALGRSPKPSRGPQWSRNCASGTLFDRAASLKARALRARPPDWARQSAAPLGSLEPVQWQPQQGGKWALTLKLWPVCE